MIISSGYMKHGLDAYGGSALKKGDLDYWINDRILKDPRGICFELGEEVEEFEPDFFELIPNLCELRVLNPSCSMLASEKSIGLFRRNKVLIRGVFDSSAEKFAAQNRLKFLHLDAMIGRAGDYYERGVDIITLRFYRDGSAYIHQDCRCPGISAGNTGGGEVSFDLPGDFFETMSDRDVAGLCWGSCYGDILERGTLASLIRKARSKGGFLTDYAKK